jgi:hypothetical protein
VADPALADVTVHALAALALLSHYRRWEGANPYASFWAAAADPTLLGGCVSTLGAEVRAYHRLVLAGTDAALPHRGAAGGSGGAGGGWFPSWLLGAAEDDSAGARVSKRREHGTALLLVLYELGRANALYASLALRPGSAYLAVAQGHLVVTRPDAADSNGTCMGRVQARILLGAQSMSVPHIQIPIHTRSYTYTHMCTHTRTYARTLTHAHAQTCIYTHCVSLSLSLDVYVFLSLTSSW